MVNNVPSITTPSGLQYQVLKEGNGFVAQSGRHVRVHYTGWLTNGTKFDSSVDRGEPFEFNLGQGQVIRGWDEGVAGMKVGEKRRLTIPRVWVTVSTGGRDDPSNATLVFDVELLGSNKAHGPFIREAHRHRDRGRDCPVECGHPGGGEVGPATGHRGPGYT